MNFMFRPFTDWRTSLVGVVGGVCTWLLQAGPINFTWERFLPALPAILLGAFMSDGGK